MKVSLIIPAYNEKDVINDCLKSLTEQLLKDFEIIVVDDGSTDGTDKILQNFKIKIVKTGHLGAGGARNEGAKRAEGKILVFVDADMTFDKNFLERLVAPIVAGKTKGTFSKDEYVSNWGNVWARCWNINQGWETKKRHPQNYPDSQPVFRAILKSEFDRVGGFTPGGYNDDWSLSEKLGYQAVAARSAVFYHKNPDNLKEIYRHAIWVGKRKYKFGAFGYLAALVRSSLPISLIIGLFKSLIYKIPHFLIFKIIYDFGISVGIIEYMLTKRGSR